jgi:thymidine kinase
MFSGKTSKLIWFLRRAEIAKRVVQVFKPDLDDRYGETEDLVSHDKLKSPATLFNPQHPGEILEKLRPSVEIVGIDEAQWCTPAIVQVCEALASRGIRVIITGLDTDYLGKPFGSIPALMAIAEEVQKLSAICMTCGEPANKTQRLTPSTEQIEVGGADKYAARCRLHHTP